jgi:hypothetical protein
MSICNLVHNKVENLRLHILTLSDFVTSTCPGDNPGNMVVNRRGRLNTRMNHQGRGVGGWWWNFVNSAQYFVLNIPHGVQLFAVV